MYVGLGNLRKHPESQRVQWKSWESKDERLRVVQRRMRMCECGIIWLGLNSTGAWGTENVRMVHLALVLERSATEGKPAWSEDIVFSIHLSWNQNNCHQDGLFLQYYLHFHWYGVRELMEPGQGIRKAEASQYERSEWQSRAIALGSWSTNINKTKMHKRSRNRKIRVSFLIIIGVSIYCEVTLDKYFTVLVLLLFTQAPQLDI